MFDLKDKLIVVTGCASGIGAETARVLKQKGAIVIGVDRNKSDAVDAFYQCDLSNSGAIDDLIKQLPVGINGLANIAGLPPTVPAEMVLKVNLIGLKKLTIGLIEKVADNASIVNLASLAGANWMKSLAPIKASYALTFENVTAFMAEHNISNIDGRSYFFSKEALIAWTHKNRWAWRARGIRMNAVSPGPVDTPILKDFIATLGTRTEEEMETIDRPGTPEDIAPVIAFLMTDEARWFRGANLALDGGMSAHMLSNIFDL